MYPVYLSIGLILIVAIVGAISERDKKSKAEKLSNKQTIIVKHNHTDAVQFVNKLQNLGYFNYVDPIDLNTIRQGMIEDFDPRNEFCSAWDNNSGTTLDFRYYLCDNEDLFEEGGFTAMLETLQPTFAEIGLKLKINDHSEVINHNTNSLNHTITINEKLYIIFKDFKDVGWGEAAQRLADILNDQLQIQNKDEKVYLINGGNEGKIIFLTEAQFQFIDTIYTNIYLKPLKVKDWCRVMEVDYFPVT